MDAVHAVHVAPYGVDANGDGVKDPYNPFDAIFAAARYLRAAGADHDIRRAIFAYNHADWYVESVVLRARVIGGMPSDLVGSLSGLVRAASPCGPAARYASRPRSPARRPSTTAGGTARRPGRATAVDPHLRPRGRTRDRRPRRAGGRDRAFRPVRRYVTLRDAYGNRFTYGRLSAVPRAVRPGVRVAGGAVFGRVAAGRGVASHLSFRVRPAGRGAPVDRPGAAARRLEAARVRPRSTARPAGAACSERPPRRRPPGRSC